MLKVAYTGVKLMFIATEEVRHLDAVAIVSGANLMGTAGYNYVELGGRAAADICPERAAGIAFGAYSGTVSGKIIRVVTQGIVSGVICGADVAVGDRLMLASAGRVMPLNTITPVGGISGGVSVNLASGLVGGGVTLQATAGALGWASGSASGLTGVSFVSGRYVGTAFNTARVLGKALASGAAGRGIPILVTLGG